MSPSGKKTKPAKSAGKKAGIAAAKAVSAAALAPALLEVRARIDGIDRQIQSLISERARFAQQVGQAKGPLKAAVDYYRPERESQVLRQVLDRNDGPLNDEVLLRLFRSLIWLSIERRLYPRKRH